MLARLAAATAVVVLSPSIAGAATPFADYCDGNVCYQRKVNMACMRDEARQLLREIAARFGKIEVASVCDGRHARRSAHYVGKAIDFRPFAASRADVVAFLKAAPNVGGVGTYSNGLIHADVADRKMAWHGRGRGRVVWPIGAGTIEKAPGDPPVQVAQAGAFAFPFNLFGSPTTAPAAPSTVAAALPPSGQVADPAAAALLDPKASRLPPLPPRRPATLLDADREAPAVQVASADGSEIGMAAFGDVGRAATPAPNPTFVALAPTPSGIGNQAFAAVTAPGTGTPAPSAGKGFDANESLFTPKAFAPPSQPGFSLARATLP